MAMLRKGIFYFVLAVVVFGYLAVYFNHRYEEKSFLDGKCKVVEGYVKNYHPMPSVGHDTEHYDVGNVHFDYSNFQIGPGYRATASYGGIIKQGLYVQITYLPENNNEIMILKVAK